MVWILLGMACLPDDGAMSLYNPRHDFDGDGVTENQGDCDDDDVRVFQGAQEICGDGLDQDCDGKDTPCDDEHHKDTADPVDAVCTFASTPDLQQELPGASTPPLLFGNKIVYGRREGGSLPLGQWARGADALDAAGTVQISSDLDRIGGVLETVGDVTGDGEDELLIAGPPLYINGDTESVYLLPGPLGGSAAVPNQTVVLTGSLKDNIAEGAAGGMDMDNDGVGDLLIGAPRLEGSGTGRVYLLYGPVDEDLDLSSQAVTIEGFDAMDGIGRSAARGGDIDGDGFEEVLVGHGQLDFEISMRMWILAGGARRLDDGSIDDADLTFLTLEQKYGDIVQPAGDVDLNRDGYDDAILGVSGAYSDEGAVFILFGERDLLDGQTLTAGDASSIIRGTVDDGRLGAAVLTAADLDADEDDELFIASPGIGVFRIDGAPAPFVELSGADLFLTAPPATEDDDPFATSLGGLNDLDEDGCPELLISAEDGVGRSGRLWVWSSTPTPID
ncbi:MAG: MopE-related protein [Myxococcota bacterium]